jgi:uncharacterized alkaline shock family protein YloU
VSTLGTESTTENTTAAGTVPAPRRGSAELAGDHGRTTIGVYAMGTGSARMIGAVRQRVPGTRGSDTQGVSVEVGERQAAADLDLVVEYGVSIPDLAAAVRGNVISSVQRICGLEVTEVNIGIDDIHLPGDQDAEPSAPRVQ